MTAAPIIDFAATRLGVIMSPQPGMPHEAWGVLNPGGARGPDGAMQLFPRLIAEGNYSRIGRARVCFNGDTPVSVERHGVALEPHESYEVNAGGGGVEDPRVVYVPLLKRYVMTYTAFVPYEPRVAIAVSSDLVTWQRLGLLHFEIMADGRDLNACCNKDVLFRSPEPVLEPREAYERNGLVDDVVFPSATDLRADGALDVYYGAADHVIAAARVALPATLPSSNRPGRHGVSA